MAALSRRLEEEVADTQGLLGNELAELGAALDLSTEQMQLLLGQEMAQRAQDVAQARPNHRALVLATRTLNAKCHSRVTLSLR